LNVEFRESFAKDLRAVTDKSILRRVRQLIEIVEKAQDPGEIGHLKKLRGGGNYFRVRVGDYRVGLRIEGDKVIFLRFLNRKEVYRYFP
jgi:mRNA interferase RelE/StbE